jgi:hypothetical protein
LNDFDDEDEEEKFVLLEQNIDKVKKNLEKK